MERTLLTRAAFAALLAAGACTDVKSDFTCTTDADCTQESGEVGRCEADQHCSYADTSCASGFRYGELAGSESDACTGAGGGSGIGSDPTACKVSEVRAGVHDTCVRRIDGTVWCFGDGKAAATQIDMPGGAVAQLDVAGAGLCARYTDGSLHCTAGPTTGNLGLTVEDVSIGSTHLCAITDGHVACWGTNATGELGIGNMDAKTTPQTVIAVNDAIDLSAGLATTCVVTAAGGIWCWGDDSRDQLGQGILSPDFTTTPVETFVEDGPATVAVGDKFVCASTTGGHVECWGDATKGQTGQGSVGDKQASPVVVSALAGIAQVTAGGGHACARAMNGNVWCWGANSAHESAASSAATVATPTLVVDRDNQPLTFLEVDAGALHTCGRVAPDGVLVCWGGNADGQIGDGTTAPAIYPTASPLGCR